MMHADSSLLRLVADHLWQSTLFAAAIAALTLLFRRHHATVRYWLWLAASLKFAVPFAVLMAFGTSMRWTQAPLPEPALRLAVQTAMQPFSTAVTTPAQPPRGTDADPDPWQDSSRPSLFTALQEQLGRKLEPQRAPIEVLVVDSVQMPTGN